MTPLRAEELQAVTFLYEQGDHFVLLHNAPGTDRHKVPLWYKYQLPRNRPSLQQCLDHLEAGGLLGHIPASLGLAVVDVDESDPDGLFDWMSRYRPLGDVPSQRAGRLHLYYDARAGWGNKNGCQLRRYGMKVDIRCMGMVAIWDLSAVAEIVAQRAMALKPGRSLPKTVLGLTERPKPPEWGGTPPPERETPPPPRRPVMGASGAYQWQCPAPPDELLQTAAGGRNTALFDAVRKSAYRLPRGSGNDDVRRRWGALWVDFAIQANRMFPEPLGEREVSKTAASVSRWTWTNPEFGRGGDDGRRDPAEQSKRGVVSGVVRRLRVRPRNARTVELHRRYGLGLRAIARIVEVSPSTIWRTLEADKLNPGCFINQLPPRGENGLDGEEIEVNDEKRNNFAADLTNENRQMQPLQQSETANFTKNPTIYNHHWAHRQRPPWIIPEAALITRSLPGKKLSGREHAVGRMNPAAGRSEGRGPSRTAALRRNRGWADAD